MKHGIKFRKLSRTSSHRQALLRNLVSALLHHEQIKTTLPKAKEAARVAEKIISLGKRGTEPARRQAQAFLYPAHHYAAPQASTSASTLELIDPEAFTAPTSLLPKLFTTLSERYASRPGGYTRITKYGRRPGDNAPKAIVSLVDGTRDVIEEITARALGREVGSLASESEGSTAGVRERIQALVGESVQSNDGLRSYTRRAVGKVLKHRDEPSREAFVNKAVAHAHTLAVAGKALDTLKAGQPAKPSYQPSSINKTTSLPHAGRHALSSSTGKGFDMHQTGLGLARGLLGSKRRESKVRKGLLPL